MDFVYRRVELAIIEVLQQSEEIAPSQMIRLSEKDSLKVAIYKLRSCLREFEIEFMCLKIFLDCIREWSDFADRMHLVSLVYRIEATVQKVAEKLIPNVELPQLSLEVPPHVCFSPISKVRRKIEKRSLKGRILKLADLFSSLKNEFMDLKPEINGVFDSWTSQSFRFCFDYNHWKDFSKFVNYYEKACSGRSDYIYGLRNTPTSKKFEDLNRHLISAKSFLDCLPRNFSKDLQIEVMIHVGRVAIFAALRFCQWWSWQEDANMENMITSRLVELQQEIDFTNSMFVDMNLKLLISNENSIENQVDKFLNCLLEDFVKLVTRHFSEFSLLDYSRTPHKVHIELKFLVISALTFLKGNDAGNLQRLLADIRVLLNQVSTLNKSYNNVSGVNVIRFENVLADIWLLNLEIILREKLNRFNILEMPMEVQISVLHKESIHLNYSEWMESIHLNYSEWLKSLNITLGHPPNAERVKQGLALIEVSTFASLITTTEGKRNVIFRLLLMILLFRAESITRPILSSNHWCFVGLDKNKLDALWKSLGFFIMVVQDKPEGTVGEAKLAFTQIEEVACGVCSLTHSSLGTGEQAVNYMNPLVSDLLEKTRSVMIELEVCLHAPYFPMTNGVGFMYSLLEKLMELLMTDLSISLKQHIEDILRDLEFLKPFLRGIPEQDIEFQDIRARIVDVAYKAEYYIDSLMVKDSVEWHNSLRLYHLQEDIRLLKEHLPTTREKIHHAKEQDMPQIPVQKKEPKATTSGIDETPVVLKDQEEMIIVRLIEGTKELDIVPIVGLPGIGKTTLARQVYNHPDVVSHFHVCTWSCISQIYSKRQTLLEMLSPIIAINDDILGKCDEDLEHILRNHLLKKKFLIVMDDLWNTEALNDLRGSFPNDGNGSRILITSRRDLKANSYADPHHLRQLSDAESWSLLQKKIFPKLRCPKELIEIGEKIAKTCKGLPLAIVAVAGILVKREKECNSWKKIAKDLSFLIVDDPQEQCRQIIELSYKNLPDYLKACFLYFGAFLEDQDIPARKLMQLWIAEGLVRKTEFKSLEDLAEDYLSDLIDRSLVIFSQQRSRGGVKTCRVHDVLQKFCQSKAKKDKFLTVITESTESYAPLRDFEYVFSAKLDNPSSSTTYKDHRLCFCTQRKHLAESRSSGPCTRSLLCFARNDKDSKCPYEISFISQNFRLLKVLDLGCINVGTSFPKGIEQMVHLRYLALAGYIDDIPSSIANLWNLEILIVRGLKDDKVIGLPDAIWCLKKLRHVHISPFAVISSQDDQHGNSSGFSYLVTFSSLFLRFEKGTEFILTKISNLRKLKCIFLESWDNSQNCNNFPRLELLNQLESLKISYYGRAPHPGEFSFPSNLKKLTLSDFHLPWDKISVIGKLRYLEVLKLLSGAFDGENWDMVEGEFSELKYLKLDMLNISKWNACSDHLPKLEQLFLRRCSQLEEGPLHIADIPTLEMIDVQWCGYRVEESARQIKEEGDENLKVFINFSELHIS